MQIIVNDRGPMKGKTSLRLTLATMLLGETWNIDASEVGIESVRSSCCSYGLMSRKRFSVNRNATTITVTRTL